METQTAIAYCRVSDPRQVKRKRREEPARERDSLDRQEAKARAFALQNRWRLARVWLEQGESAKTDDRTELWRMHDWCKRNRGTAQVLIIPKIDRFARNLGDYHDLKRRFLALGVRIASVDERIEDTPEGRLQENVLASFAQFDNERRAERCKDGMVEAVRAGRWVWKAPYGYRNVKRADEEPNIAPYEDEARLIRRAFELIDARCVTPQSAYTALAAEGLALSRPRFFKALRCTTYAGLIRAFGLEAAAAPPFVPLVSGDVFWRVQARLDGNGGPHRKSYSLDHPDFPLRGTVRCACGRYMTASWSRGKYSRFGYYRCVACAGQNHPMQDVETGFRRALDAHRCPPSVFDDLSDNLVRFWKERHETAARDRRRLLSEKERLKELQKALALKAAAGLLPDDIVREQIDDLRRQSAGLERQVSDAANPQADVPDLLAFAWRFVQSPGEFWERSGLPTKKRLQSFLLPEGSVYTRSENFGTPHLRLLKPISGLRGDASLAWWTSDSNLETLVADLRELYYSLKGVADNSQA